MFPTKVFAVAENGLFKKKIQSAGMRGSGSSCWGKCQMSFAICQDLQTEPAPQETVWAAFGLGTRCVSCCLYRT